MLVGNPEAAQKARFERAKNQYDAAIGKHGKCQRIEAYQGCSTPILHRCLIHEEEHKAIPSGIKKGRGLQCCLKAVREETQRRQVKEAAEVYDQKIAKIGRLARIEEYQGAQKKILHKCLEHGEEGLIKPTNALSGRGLSCCRREAVKISSAQQSDEAKKRFDEFMKSHQYLVALEPYKRWTRKMLFRCDLHSEEHLSTPAMVMRGSGLACCGKAKRKAKAQAVIEESAKTYDERIAVFNRVKRIEPYQGVKVKTKHDCLIHGEVHLFSPQDALVGKGPPCCNTGTGWDSLERILDGKMLRTKADKQTEFYVFNVPDHKGWFKIGIALTSKARSSLYQSKGLYGEQVGCWLVSTRRNAVLIETAILRDPSFGQPYSKLDHLSDKAGFSELRQAEENQLLEHIQSLVDSLEEDPEGWASSALDHIPELKDWERKKLQELSA